jgi:hypothetical protein
MITEPESLLRDHYVRVENGLRLRFFKEHGRVTLLVEVGQDTSLEMLRQSWRAIDTWRRLLQEWQGSIWWDTDDGWLFESLAQEHRGGKSYAALAQELNDLLMLMLSWAVKDEEAMQAANEASDKSFRLWGSQTLISKYTSKMGCNASKMASRPSYMGVGLSSATTLSAGYVRGVRDKET